MIGGQRQSDLLFGVELDGRAAFLYVLVEHQSRPDPQMPFRVLRYVVRIGEQWQAERDQVRQGGGPSELPVVIPLVLYHGQRAWNAPRTLQEMLVPDPRGMGDVEGYVPELELCFDDLHRQSDEAIMGRPMTAVGRLALLLLKHGR